ncbi:hypothetical protein N7491_009933 [Penicillium cf. griseofulvum]|uniref:non-specific serine/threonine protein kinase n=1 Tax=Penicillium cf. griseofulvum TaxID=2972120 RepID=A0A9W9T5C8_9EURO|nr:hypothetical protein N7472_000262 [Penicillium cf. griseofulvum]KAJ5421488.1 hypothetical protein N7491_009933 [Penicillium cf. griseofulvum]KAJ5424721.1 hypothetical protein N7445_010694 [Penicillium cf. griseofulvum]
MTRCLNIFANPVRFSVSLPSSRHPVPFSQPLRRRTKLDLGPFRRLGSTMAENYRIEYNWIKGVEALEKYQPGVYHPVMVWDVLRDRYHIVDKLGFGGYLTVWLARDTHLHRYVAVKVNTANPLPRESKVLKALSAPLPWPSPVHPGRGSIPVLLDKFKVRGPNGENTCYTVAPAQCNLREDQTVVIATVYLFSVISSDQDQFRPPKRERWDWDMGGKKGKFKPEATPALQGIGEGT